MCTTNTPDRHNIVYPAAHTKSFYAGASELFARSKREVPESAWGKTGVGGEGVGS